MHKRGWQVYGFDFSPEACRLLEAKIGRDHVFCGDILRMELKEDFYDVITLWQVIEHLPQPLETLKICYNHSSSSETSDYLCLNKEA